jgi:3-methyladenine DNA glycosylase AlkC
MISPFNPDRLRLTARQLAALHPRFAHSPASPDKHPRRLASEGSRPRLPWGQSLHRLATDPSPTLPLLAALRANPSLNVR